ncbi:MAG: hypothetical protein HC924_17475 [Synechococcaceae cyanobacterium SM2_3_2]|nr:hypothetical protein [Synechococcaceae cyanobacterium SM2_3_2]
MNSRHVDLWLAALAVLECPMSIEDKKKTLRQGILFEVGGSFELLDPLEQTGLEPFDRAAKKTFYRLQVEAMGVDDEDIG